jgi:hypothetical protein
METLEKFGKIIHKLNNLKENWFIDLISNAMNNEWLI